MCRIGFEIENFSGTAKGRYKRKTDSSWIVFDVDFSDKRTPDITDDGVYDFEIMLEFAFGGDWQRVGTFEVGNCNNAT